MQGRPAIVLVAAAGAAALFPWLHRLPHHVDERIVTVALVVVLFDGGLQIGLPRFRSAASPIVVLGLAGTLVTAAGLALVAHFPVGLGWREALLLAAALSPTDPAAVFNALAGREIEGRTGTILQGESGANDPVGIALMVAILGSSGAGWGPVGHAAGVFVLQLAVGTAVGLAGGLVLAGPVGRLPLPNAGLRLVRSLVVAFLVYGVAALLHGSGFLAVLLAGVIVGETDAPQAGETERLTAGLAGVAEIVAFAVLGLTVDLGRVVSTDALWIGLLLFAILTAVVRPLAVALLLGGTGLGWNERAFLSWGGLKGAVPLLLGLYAVTGHAAHAGHLYAIVFVVVLASVVIQGGTIPVAASLCRVPMRASE